MSKKILFSLLTGFIILLLTWVYENLDYSRPVEDTFFKNLYKRAYEIFPLKLKKKADFVFVNTGKDLALVEDTLDYGNITVSDREKIYKLVHHINNSQQKPLYTVLDIQFYYPYTVNPSIDSALQNEIRKNKKLLIPVVKDGSGEYKKPLYKANYAYSDYTTYGSNFNKFRIFNKDAYNSIPITLHQSVNEVEYEKHLIFSTANNRLCLAAVWPTFYLKNDKVQEVLDVKQVEEIKDKEKNVVYTEYYNIGELLLSLDGNVNSDSNLFKNKIIIIGNFEGDVHNTTVGKMSGPILLANIYLSLLNNQHIASFWFFLLLWLTFSALSYVALYSQIPNLKINLNIILSSQFNKWLKTYVTYWGILFLLSIIVVFLFKVQVALFFPALLFTVIEYFSKKRYSPIIETFYYFRNGDYKTSLAYIAFQRFRKKFYLIKK